MSGSPLDLEAANLDALYERARAGDTSAFGDWAARVERSLRASLRSFARAVDVEAVLQEALFRMWEVARSERVLEGRDASLRYALGVARNLALREARRLRTVEMIPLVELFSEPAATTPTPSDPLLREHIEACIQALPQTQREAVLRRIEMAPESDRRIAELLGVNAPRFRQWLCRARKALLACLRAKGVTWEVAS